MTNQKSNRDVQVSNWEKHLAGIIEQTNKNIDYLSRSVKSNEDMSAKFMRPPPPPPRLAHSGRRPLAPVPPSPTIPTNPHLPTSPSHYQRQAKEVLNASRGAVSVSRPLSKHIEDDVTRRIGQSVKRTVERTITEKSHAGQARVDRLSDQLEHLSEDIVKMHKDHIILSQSFASQDRLSKRLKDEWEKQRGIVKKLEAEMLKDLGWKEATTVDLKVLNDQQIQDNSLRVTSNELRSAMEAIASKLMVAVDRATTASRTSFESELSVLKEEINALKDENKMLRENFNEVHVKSIISGAVEGHLNRVEAKITSSAQSMVGTAIKASEEKINAGIVGRVKDCLGREVMKTRERENELEEQLTSDIDFKKQVNLLLASQLGEFKECLVKDIGKMTKEKIRDSKIERDMMKEMVNNTMDEVKEMMKGQKALDPEDLEVMRARVLDLEQRVHNNHVIAEVAALSKVIQTILDGNSKNENNFNRISEDVSLIYNATELKHKKVENELKTYMDTQVQAVTKEGTELKKKVQASLAVMSQFGNRIDSVEETTKDKVVCGAETMVMGELEKACDLIKFEFHRNLDNIGRVIDTKFQASEGCMQDLRDTITRREDELEEKVDLLSKTSTDIETRTTTHTDDIRNELYMLKADVGTIKETEEKAKSSLTDLVSCYGKVSALENKINVDMSVLQSEFVNLQDNIIDVNAASQERINILVKEVREELSSCTKGAERQSQEPSVDEGEGKTYSSTKISQEMRLQQSRLEKAEIKIGSLENDVTDNKSQTTYVEESLKIFREQSDEQAMATLDTLNEIQSKCLNEKNHRSFVENDLKTIQRRISELKEKEEPNVNRHITPDNEIVMLHGRQVAFRDESEQTQSNENEESQYTEKMPYLHASVAAGLLPIVSDPPSISIEPASFSMAMSESVEGSISEYDRIEAVSTVELVTENENTNNLHSFDASDKEVDAVRIEILSTGDELDNSISECMSSFDEESIASLDNSFKIKDLDMGTNDVATARSSDNSSQGQPGEKSSNSYDSSFESEIGL